MTKVIVWVKKKRLAHHPVPQMNLVACVFSRLLLVLSLVHCFGYDYCDYFSSVLGYLLFLSPFSVVLVTEIFAFTMTQNCDGRKDVVKRFYKCRLTLSLGITRSVMQQFTPTSFILSFSVSTAMLLKEEGSLLVPDSSC